MDQDEQGIFVYDVKIFIKFICPKNEEKFI
jgi:hypothetical protein